MINSLLAIDQKDTQYYTWSDSVSITIQYNISPFICSLSIWYGALEITRGRRWSKISIVSTSCLRVLIFYFIIFGFFFFALKKHITSKCTEYFLITRWQLFLILPIVDIRTLFKFQISQQQSPMMRKPRFLCM